VPLPYEELVRGIRAGRVACAYLLAGPDGLQRAEVLAALSERVGPFGVRRAAGEAVAPGDVVAWLRTPSLAGARLVVVDDPPWVLPAPGGGEDDRAPARRADAGARGEAAEEPLVRYLDAPAPGAVLALVARSEADGRRRLTRKIAERGVWLQAVAPRERDGAAWLRARCRAAGLELAAEAFEVLAARLTGATCERMAAEVEKLRTYAAGGHPLDRAALDRLVPPEPQERVYDLVDAALAGRGGQALRMAQALLAQGEPAARLLAALAGQLRAVVAVADACAGGARPEEAAGRLGLHPFVARKALDQARRLPPEAALAAAEAVWRAEWALKSGRADEAAAVDQAVLGVLRAAGGLR
jgi:DNA polymerase-3 subunit delta